MISEVSAHIIIGALTLICSVAFAVPQEFDRCPIAAQIVEPDNSQGYRMSADCRTAYVLPPIYGRIAVGPIATSDSRSKCSAISAAVNGLSSEVLLLAREQKNELHIINAIERDHAACAPYESEKKELDHEKELTNDQIKKYIADLRTLRLEKNRCGANSDTDQCDNIESFIEEKQDQIENARERLSDEQYQANDVDEQVDYCLEQHPQAQTDNSVDEQKVQALTRKIEMMAHEVNRERSTLSSEPGGNAVISFVSGQEKLVDQFKSMNQGLNVTFEPISLKSVQIHFQLVSDGKAAKLSSVSQFDILGAGEIQANNSDGFSVPGAQDVARLFGGGVGAQIALNLYATCGLESKYGDTTSVGARDFIADLIKPTVTFNYEVQAAKDIKIMYNESYLYQLIKQHTVHGGLFWTSSSDSITEDSVARNWLRIDESAQDSNLSWTDSERRLFELRQEVLNAALARVTLKTYVTPGEAIADGGTPPKDGAAVASTELHKCPDKYCQAAAFVLDLSNAVFGGSSASGSAMKTIKTSDIENLIVKGMVTFSGTQTFESGDQ